MTTKIMLCTLKAQQMIFVHWHHYSPRVDQTLHLTGLGVTPLPSRSSDKQGRWFSKRYLEPFSAGGPGLTQLGGRPVTH